MGKIALGMTVGTMLGLLDGLLTFFSPEAVEMGMMPMIIIGSTIKGFITGIAIGWLSKRYRSYVVGIVGGLAAGLVLSLLVALMPDPNGNYHFVEILAPGAILGGVVGFVCQRWGNRPASTD